MPQQITLGLLYALAGVLIDIYFYARTAGVHQNQVVHAGFLISITGFVAGLLGVQYLIAKHFAYEMGNMETLGYQRFRYLALYTLQFFATAILAWIFSIVLFGALLIMGPLNSMTVHNILHAYSNSFLFVIIIAPVSLLFSFFAASAKEPALLMKEKP